MTNQANNTFVLLKDGLWLARVLFSFLVGKIFGWHYTLLTFAISFVKMKKGTLIDTYFSTKSAIEEGTNKPIAFVFVPIVLGIILLSEVSDTCFSVIRVLITKIIATLYVFPLTRGLVCKTFDKFEKMNMDYSRKRRKVLSDMVDTASRKASNMFLGNEALAGVASGYINKMINTDSGGDNGASNPMTTSPFGDISKLMGSLGNMNRTGMGDDMSPPPFDMSKLFAAPPNGSNSTNSLNQADKTRSQKDMMKRILNASGDDKTVTDDVDKTVTDDVDKTVTDNVDKTVTDDVDKTVTDNVDKTVTDNVKTTGETTIQRRMRRRVMI